MAYHFVIDGYNILYAYKFSKAKQKDSWKDLVSRLRRLFGKKMGNQITVFFDGTAGPGNPTRFLIEGVEVIFTVDEEADEAIRRMVRRRGKKERLLVVSSDRQVKDYARLHGVKAVGAGEVLERLFPKKPKTVAREEKIDDERARKITEELMKKYGLE